MTPSLRDRRAARRTPRRLIALTLALAAVSAGCVRQGGPGVKVNALDAELVFGVKLPGESAPTPPEVPTPMPEGDFGFAPFDTPTFDIPLGLDPPRVRTGCSDEFEVPTPQRDADVVITGDGANGVYEYKGAFVVHRADGTRETRRLPTERREVRNYKRFKQPHPVQIPGRVREINFITYDYIQPFGANFLKTGFQIKMNNPDYQAVPRNQAENPAVDPQTIPRTTNDPELGVAITGTELIDAKGNRVPGSEPFNPSNAILLLPLPIQSETFTSSGVDDSSGRTFVNQATVQARERINACGEPVDGWLVEGFIAISDRKDPTAGTDPGNPVTKPGGASYENQYRWNYILAPQYGGLIIGEEIYHANDRANPPRRPESTIRTIANIDPL